MALRDTVDDGGSRIANKAAANGSPGDGAGISQMRSGDIPQTTYREMITGTAEKVVVNESGASDPWNLRAEAFLNMGKLDEAESCYIESLKTDPGNQKTLYKTATLMVKKKDDMRALFFFDKLLEALGDVEAMDEIEPLYLLSWVNKGNILAGMSRHDDAITCYDWVLELDDTFVPAWFNKALVLFELKRYKESIFAVDRLLKLAPRDYDALNLRGLLIYSIAKTREESESVKMMDEALRVFHRITLAKPDHLNALNNKSMVLVELGRYEMALSELNTALKNNNNHPILLFCVARAYAGIGDKEKAKMFLKRALAAMPELVHKAQKTRQFSILKGDQTYRDMMYSSTGRTKSEWREGEVKKIDSRR